MTPERLPNPFTPRTRDRFPGSVTRIRYVSVYTEIANGLPGVLPLSQAAVNGAET
jgi:hypothetical protein